MVSQIAMLDIKDCVAVGAPRKEGEGHNDDGDSAALWKGCREEKDGPDFSVFNLKFTRVGIVKKKPKHTHGRGEIYVSTN